MENDLNSTVAPLSQLVQWFETSEQQTFESRELMDRDVDYYDGKQLTAEHIAALKKRKQPPIVINHIKAEIDYLAGMEKSQRVDPKAYPRNPQDEQAAYAATKALQYVTESMGYEQVRSDAWKGLLKPGVAFIRVGAKPCKEGDYDPDLEEIGYDRAFWDHHSRRGNFEDARYLGFVTWTDFDAAIDTYGEEIEPLLTASNDNNEGISNFYDDKPKHNIWVDMKRKRVRLVQMYYKRKGVWHETIFTKTGEILNQVSPYLDENGEPECPLIGQSAYVDRENNRYGQIREMIDPQDDYNKRRSKATHILNSRQVIADKGAVDDPNKARRDFAMPDAWIERNPGKEINPQSNTGLESGQFQLMQEAGSQLRANSIKNSMIGGNDQSGRAKQAQQQASMIEIGDLLDKLRDMDRRVFQAIWNRIKQFWQAPRWIRVTDDPQNVQHLGLNVPLTDPMGNVQQMQNPVAEMNIDLRIEETPDSVSLQQEAYESWVTQVAPSLLQAGMPPLLVAQASIELMPHSRAKEVAKELLEKAMQSQQQAPDPMAEKMKEIAVAKEAATVDEIQSKTVKNLADARAKTPEQVPVPVPVPVAANQF